ncbi:MAG: glycosyltransferase family 4 protein [Caldilineaceae bacterium]
MQTLRILLFNTQMEAGGAQKALLELASGLKCQGHRVIVVTMYDKGDFVSYYSQKYGLPIVNLQIKKAGSNKFLTPFRFLLGMWQLYLLLRKHNIQILQTFSHYSNIVGPCIGWLARAPVRVTSQRMSLSGRSRWLQSVDRLITNSFLTSKMTSVSEGTRQYSITQQGIDANKVITIHNGVDVDCYNKPKTPNSRFAFCKEFGIPIDAKVITTVARLHTQKGHTYLLEAVPTILQQVPNAHFVFVGDGILCEQIHQQIHQLGIEDHIHMIGVRQDIPYILANSDLFVLPSLWEGLPNVILEAMAAQVPVVATNVDGTPELVTDGETGCLVPPAHSQQLSQAILRLLCDNQFSTYLSTNAFDRINREFSNQKNVEQYVNLYTKLLTNHN